MNEKVLKKLLHIMITGTKAFPQLGEREEGFISTGTSFPAN
jgi:hypothetical protein